MDGGGPVFTGGELEAIIIQLKHFRRAQSDFTTQSAAMAADHVYSGGGGGGVAVRLVQSEPRAVDAAVAASEARHAAAMETMANMAARQDASLAAMMAVVMRAHVPLDPPAPTGGGLGGGGRSQRPFRWGRRRRRWRWRWP